MILLAATTVALALTSVAVPPDRGRAPVVEAAAGESLDVGLLDLAAVRRLFHARPPREGAVDEIDTVAALAELALLAEAVLGAAPQRPFAYQDFVRAASREGPRVPASPAVAARDAAAYQLLALGYSPREVADVVSRRISHQALDTARRMIAVGMGHEAAADYLDRQYTRMAALQVVPPPAPDQRPGHSGGFEAFIERSANRYRVGASIVRAMIQAESAFNPRARSSAGAIGLMQLMPSTARELGVNPLVPEQNIDGGVRYFARMLEMFGGVELALVAYNAGPGFARRHARGEAALYGETRAYVRQVLARLDPALVRPFARQLRHLP